LLLIRQEQPHQSARQLLGDFVQVHPLARTRRALHPQRVAIASY
jgi:hypothetical protein